MNPNYFDIKCLEPGIIHDSIGARSVNLMCAILNDITYNELYTSVFHEERRPGDPETILDRIINNIDNLHEDLQVGATTDDKIVIERLAGRNGVFVQIRDILVYADYPKVRLGDLFHKNIHSGIDTKNEIIMQMIVSILDGVHRPDESNEDQMYHFCVPFLTIQKNRIPTHDPHSKKPKKSKPDQDAFKEFLKVLGDHTLRHMYDGTLHSNHTYSDQRQAAKRALDRCILKEHGRLHKPGPRAGVTTSDGNNRHCEANSSGTGSHCETCAPEHPDDWCNQYTSGGTTYCSLGSDYHS